MTFTSVRNTNVCQALVLKGVNALTHALGTHALGNALTHHPGGVQPDNPVKNHVGVPFSQAQRACPQSRRAGLSPAPGQEPRAVLSTPCPSICDLHLRSAQSCLPLRCQHPRCRHQCVHGCFSSSRTGDAHPGPFSPASSPRSRPGRGMLGDGRGWPGPQGCRAGVRAASLPQPTPAAGKGRGHLAVASSRETEAQAEAGVLQGHGLEQSWPCLL